MKDKAVERGTPIALEDEDGSERAISNNMGIGASVLRKEDYRHLHGKGQFVADLVFPDTLEMAVVRSAVAHAKLLAVKKPEGLVFCQKDMSDLTLLMPMNISSEAKKAVFPVLAFDKVRYVGEPVAVALAASRAEAEDLAEDVEVVTDSLPALVTVETASLLSEVRVHDEWSDNIVQEMNIECGDVQAKVNAELAPVVVSRTYRTSRQAMNPMEGKACLAYWDERVQQLTLYSSTQVPHMIRDAISEALGLPQAQVRVVAPDVGGGFGYKCLLQAEEIIVCWLAMTLRRPIRWLEDRREHLIAAANAREQVYSVTAYADKDGVLLGLKADIAVDAGAYSVIPFSNVLDAGMALGNMTGPYRIPYYKGRARSVATNKPPVAPYRGVGRPGACFAIEQLMDAVAREVGRDPYAVRADNLIAPSEMPYTSVTGKTYDSGDYPQALLQAVKKIGEKYTLETDRQSAKRRGIGVAFFVELTGHSPKAAHDWKLPVRAGAEPATVRLTGDGTLEVRLGLQSHGQGMETTMAQVVHEILGLDIANIVVLHGDTGNSSYSTGTYASRGMVVGAGAVAGACRALAKRLCLLGTSLMKCPGESVQVIAGEVQGPEGKRISFAEIARIWHTDFGKVAGVLAPEESSLEVNYGYAMTQGLGAYTYGAHAALVEVNVDSGHVSLLDYVVVEDCGTAVNPMVVDGQIIGGVVQGIGTALYEESSYDATGQPKSATLVDYLLPGAGDVPFIRIDHLVHPSPFTEFGIKGVGEGGAIPSAAAVCSAVNDALKEWDIELSETPLTPQRILAALMHKEAL
jgi:carbon-monoxide dehydrogenase large subunit